MTAIFVWLVVAVIVCKLRQGSFISLFLTLLLGSVMMLPIGYLINELQNQNQTEQLQQQIAKSNEMLKKQDEVKRILEYNLGLFIDKEIKSISQIEEVINRSYIETYGTIPDKTWAEDLLNSLPDKKQQLETLIEKKQKLTDPSRMAVSRLFEYTFKTFDTRIDDLIQKGQNFHVIRRDYQLLPDSSSQTFIAREVIFPNGQTLKLSVYSGFLRDGIIAEFPVLWFNGPVTQIENIKFGIMKKHEGIKIVAAQNPPQRISDLEYNIDAEPVADQSILIQVADNIKQIIASILML